MKKINNKGFVLAETLVVTVFVMTIFTLLYVNFFPLLGEYAKREFYDDIDSKYDAYWIKRMVQNDVMLSNDKFNSYIEEINANNYAEIKCSDFEPNFQSMCKEYINLIVADNPAVTNESSDDRKLIRILLTNYITGTPDNNSSFKQMMKQDSISNNSKFSSNFQEYVSYIPNFNVADSPNGANYRIVIEFRRKIDINSDSSDDNLYYTFANIEVNR